jgi:hypothetical protein
MRGLVAETQYHEEFEQYVLENPGYFAVFVATGKSTAADFAMTMWVDLARLGEGAAEGSVKGIVQDPIERYTAAELGHARRRGPTWRNYPL